MANITPLDGYNPVYQLEEDDYALGGPDGVMNLQAKSLAGRDDFLKDEIDTVKSRADVLEDAVNHEDTGIVATNERLDIVSAKVDSGAFSGVLEQGGAGSADIIISQEHNGKVIVPQSTNLNFQLTTNSDEFIGDMAEIRIFAAVQTCSIQKINSVNMVYSGTLTGGDTIELAIGDVASIWGSGASESWFVHVTSNK